MYLFQAHDKSSFVIAIKTEIDEHFEELKSQTNLYFNEKAIKTKAKLSEIWEKFKDKIIPALIISFVYYIIWLIFFKIIPVILKYLISVAQQFKQP